MDAVKDEIRRDKALDDLTLDFIQRSIDNSQKALQQLSNVQEALYAHVRSSLTRIDQCQNSDELKVVVRDQIQQAAALDVQIAEANSLLQAETGQTQQLEALLHQANQHNANLRLRIKQAEQANLMNLQAQAMQGHAHQPIHGATANQGLQGAAAAQNQNPQVETAVSSAAPNGVGDQESLGN